MAIVWRFRGFGSACNEAHERIKRWAQVDGYSLYEYIDLIDVAFNPVCDQLEANPRDSVHADVQRLTKYEPRDIYVAFSEFCSWGIIYEVLPDARTEEEQARPQANVLREVEAYRLVNTRDPDDQALMFSD